MKYTDRELNTILDDATAEIRGEKLDAAVVAGASQRVWARLAGEQAAIEAGATPVEHIRNCQDFQSLIPAYLQGSLSGARTMLLEDHTRECVPCRKALKEARYGNQAAARQLETQRAKVIASNRRMTTGRWGVAAARGAGAGLFAWPSVQRFVNSFYTLNAIVEAANGNVYRVTNNSTQALKPGEKVQKGDHIRTAKNAAAVVKLSDGSRIEMRERSEFSVTDGTSGRTINLERGQVIVEAAKQRDGKLFVATDDSLVSVTGTTFSVNNGTKGARVSVIEGEVHVDHAGKNDLLHAGDQITTHESIERIPVKEEIAWSRNAAQYTKQLDAVRGQIDQNVAMPGNRYSTRLLDLMPENTVLYVAIPNISETLAKANQILQENLAKNTDLKNWYDEEQRDAKGKFGLHQAIKQVTQFGQYLGQEIAVGAQPDGVLVLAEVNDAGGVRNYLEGQLSQLNSKSTKSLPVQIVDDPLTSALPLRPRGEGGDSNQLLVWIQGNVLAASTEMRDLQALQTSLKNNAASQFAASDFHAKLADVYREGAGFLIAADLEKIIGKTLMVEGKNARAAQAHQHETAALDQLGVTGLRHFIVELKEKDGKPYNRAVVSYKESQHGVTSWLAAPGPMGALEFISPDANVVGAFVVKEPTALVDDLLNTLQTAHPDAWQKLQDFQTERGISIRNDIAAPLGGEYAFAIDGPLLPTPSWKAIFQVDDQAHLQQTLELTVDKLNAELTSHGNQPLVWTRADSGGRTFYELKTAGLPVAINYAYAYGYLIAAPSRALVENAIQYKESGHTLLGSAKFKASLPEDQQANFSAMVYQNVGSVLGPAARLIGNAESREAGKAVKGFIGDKAGLAYVYALGDRMILSVNSENGPIGLTPSDLLGLPGSSGLGSLFNSAGERESVPKHLQKHDAMTKVLKVK
jgi:ferric-dicitrate binding protein FerR (iron transport regulator)